MHLAAKCCERTIRGPVLRMLEQHPRPKEVCKRRWTSRFDEYLPLLKHMPQHVCWNSLQVPV